MKLKLIFCGFLAFTATLCFGWSKDGEVPWRRIDDSFVTPHRTFANPMAGRKSSAIFFTCGISQRELVELKQRFEYKYYLWPVWNSNTFSPFVRGYNAGKLKSKRWPIPYAVAMTAEEYREEEKKLLKELDKSELIVLGKFSFDAFPTYMRTRILNRIKSGKGMLVVCPDGTEQKIPGAVFKDWKIDFPINAIPSLAGTKIKMAKLGKGKVVLISYPKMKADNTAKVGALAPYESEDPLYYDYIMAFIGKVFWQMTEPDRAVIASVSADGNVVLKKNAPAGSRLAYAVADEFGRVIFKGEKKAAKNVTIQLPEFPATARMLDVKLLTKDGKTIDYAVAPLKVKKAVTIKNIVLPKDGWQIDETVTGKVELSAPVKKGVLKLFALDNFGREIYRKEFKISGGKTVDFTAEIYHQKSTHAALTAQLILNGKFVDEFRTDLYFDTSKDVSDFIFGVWTYAASNTRISNIFLEQLYRHGADTIMECCSMYASGARARFIPRNLRRHGFQFAPYTTRLVGQWVDKVRGCGYRFWEMSQKSGSPFDKAGRPLDGQKRAQNVAEGAKGLGVLFYNLGDENAAAERLQYENCFCPDCQRRFRNYLKRNHGTIANLNKAYGTSYKSFNDVAGRSLGDACKTGKLCEWVDFRLFMEEEFTNWHRYHAAKIRAIDPEGRIGAEGLQGTGYCYSGFNLVKMLPHFGFCALYFNSRDGLALSQYIKGDSKLAPIRGAWFGSYEGLMNDQTIQQDPWRFLFQGMNCILYWYSGNTAAGSSYSTACVYGPDLRLLSQFTKAGEQVKIIKESGIGKILINSTPRYDDILIHYSNNNLHVATLSPDKSTWPLSIADFRGLLAGLGLGARYIDPATMEKGIPAGTKVLILPYSQGMSDKEVAAVKTFVRNGGMVIADHLPAVANQYGRFYSDSALQDVFGEFRKMKINRYGKGYAVYLDDYISGVTAKIARGEARGIQNGMLHLFKLAGVKPFFAVTDEKGKRQDVTVFENGTEKYLCILAPKTQMGVKRKTAAGAESAMEQTSVGGSLFRKVTLAKPMHVYDVMNGNKYLGYVKEFSVNLQPAVGRPFVCLERPAGKPQISVKGFFASTISAGEVITFKTKNYNNTGIVTVKDPSGKVRDVQRITGDTARFIPAFNEPEGKWTAELKNAVGGQTSTVTFHVK